MMFRMPRSAWWKPSLRCAAASAEKDWEAGERRERTLEGEAAGSEEPCDLWHANKTS